MESKNKQEARPIFIYLAILGVILGIAGIAIMVKNPVGKVTIQEDIYSKEEIVKHNSREDCWVSSNGKVYDITFLMLIEKSLRDKCGKDVSLRLDEHYEIGTLK